MRVLYLVLEVHAQAPHAVHLVEDVPDLRLDAHHRRALVEEPRELGHAPRRAHANQLAQVHL